MAWQFFFEAKLFIIRTTKLVTRYGERWNKSITFALSSNVSSKIIGTIIAIRLAVASSDTDDENQIIKFKYLQTQHSWKHPKEVKCIARGVNNPPFSLPFIVLVSPSPRSSLILPPPPVFPPLQLFAFIICLYSVSMHLLLHVLEMRTLVNTDRQTDRRGKRGERPHCGPLPFEVCIWGPWCHEGLFWLEPHGNHLRAGLTVLITTTWQATIAHYEPGDFWVSIGYCLHCKKRFSTDGRVRKYRV